MFIFHKNIKYKKTYYAIKHRLSDSLSAVLRFHFSCQEFSYFQLNLFNCYLKLKIEEGERERARWNERDFELHKPHVNKKHFTYSPT